MSGGSCTARQESIAPHQQVTRGAVLTSIATYRDGVQWRERPVLAVLSAERSPTHSACAIAYEDARTAGERALALVVVRGEWRLADLVMPEGVDGRAIAGELRGVGINLIDDDGYAWPRPRIADT